MLLFFPLFVVVVGVDSRWLLHSLRQHSRVFQDTSPIADDFPIEHAHWQSTPLNYLEKIFQIPFAIQPMPLDGFERLIDSLTEYQGSSQEGDIENTKREKEESSGATGESKLDKTEGQTIASVVSSPEAQPLKVSETAANSRSRYRHPFDANPRNLRIEDFERTFMRELYPLIPSPRAAKRFVNIYRLLRTSVSDDALPSFVKEDNGGEYQSVQLLLAIQTGYPAQAMQIIQDLIAAKPELPWWDFIQSYNSPDVTSVKSGAQHGKQNTSVGTQTASELAWRPEGERWRELLDKLKPLRVGALADRSCAEFIKWGPRVARYSFQSVRVLSGPAHSAR